jgi:hypothetical protein
VAEKAPAQQGIPQLRILGDGRVHRDPAVPDRRDRFIVFRAEQVKADLSQRSAQRAPGVYLKRKDHPIGFAVEKVDVQRAAIPEVRRDLPDGLACVADLLGAAGRDGPDAEIRSGVTTARVQEMPAGAERGYLAGMLDHSIVRDRENLLAGSEVLLHEEIIVVARGQEAGERVAG